MLCEICGRPGETCAHTTQSLRPVSLDDETDLIQLPDEEVMVVGREYLGPEDANSVTDVYKSVPSGESLLFDPEEDNSISQHEALERARLTVIEMLKNMNGREVLERAIRHMMNETLVKMQIEGPTFRHFDFDVEIPLRRAVFSVSLRRMEGEDAVPQDDP